MTVGLVIRDDSGKEQFNSSRNHLLVDLNADPKHFDTVRILGSNQSVGAGATAKEKLLTIPHKLGYTPVATAYFYQLSDVAGGGISQFGTYYRNFYSYLPLGSGGGDDVVNITADDTNLYVVHTTVSYGPPFSSTAASTPLAVKYYIFSRPAYNNPTL